jgi:hypothetical protein
MALAGAVQSKVDQTTAKRLVTIDRKQFVELSAVGRIRAKDSPLFGNGRVEAINVVESLLPFALAAYRIRTKVADRGKSFASKSGRIEEFNF